MSYWKIIIEHYGKSIVLEMRAKSYAEAYLSAAMEYPESRITSIKPIEKDDGKQLKKNK